MSYAEFKGSKQEPLFEPSEEFFISVAKWAILGAVVGFGLAILCAVVI